MKYALRRSIDLLKRDGLFELCRGVIRYFRWTYPFPEIRMRHLYNRMKYGSSVADPFKIIEVNPSDITHTTDEFAMFYHVGVIRDGDWDQQTKPVESNFKYQAVWDHFRNDVPWKDTDLFDHYSKLLAKEGQADKYTSIAALKQRYKQIDRIYEDIRTSNFKSPAETAEGELTKKERHDYPTVHIARDGELLFGDGWHRFTIARLLRLDEIPVRIIARHKKWQEIRNVKHHCDPSTEYTDHPDLQDL